MNILIKIWKKILKRYIKIIYLKRQPIINTVKRIGALYFKDIHVLFNSNIFYILATLYAISSGIFFAANLFSSTKVSMESLFSIAPFLLLFVSGGLASGSVSSESSIRKTAILEFIMATGTNTGQYIISKFLAAFTGLSTIILITLFFVVTTTLVGDLNIYLVFSGYMGMLMLGSLYISISIFCSSLLSRTSLSFGLMIIIWLGINFSWTVSAIFSISSVGYLANLSALNHFTNFFIGEFALSDFIYFIALNMLFLHASRFVLDIRRLI